jgi:segregation and condensation protein A
MIAGDGAPDPAGDAALIVDVDGYEGPLDLLLAMARTQKVDLRAISVLALARQYLDFVEAARALRIELAADYLVMAAWLAYLKSRLLLPPEPAADGPDGDEMAAHLAWQLRRLSAMRDAGAVLMDRPRLGRERFARGLPETVTRVREVRWTAALLDLLQGYARVRTRDAFRPLVMDRDGVMALEEALKRLRPLIGASQGWRDLAQWLPEGWRADPVRRRSATASHFAAVLELVKSGEVLVRQAGAFAPVEVRSNG